MNLTLGLDMGDKHTKFAVLDSEGELVEEGTVRTTPDDFKRVFGRVSVRFAQSHGVGFGPDRRHFDLSKIFWPTMT